MTFGSLYIMCRNTPDMEFIRDYMKSIPSPRNALEIHTISTGV